MEEKKTVGIAIKDLKQSIATAIETSNLDASIIELVLQDYLNQIHIIMLQSQSNQVIKEEFSDGEHINPDSSD